MVTAVEFETYWSVSRCKGHARVSGTNINNHGSRARRHDGDRPYQTTLGRRRRWRRALFLDCDFLNGVCMTELAVWSCVADADTFHGTLIFFL